MNEFKTTPHQDRVFDLLSRDYTIPGSGPVASFYLRQVHLGVGEAIAIDVILPHCDGQKFCVELYMRDTMLADWTFETWEGCNGYLKNLEDLMLQTEELSNKVKRKNAKGAKSRTTY